MSGVVIGLLGNWEKIRKRRPKNHINEKYRCWRPFKFKWRHKIGDTECSCKKVIESYMPWMGMTWFHEDECALMVKVAKRPQLLNLPCFYNVRTIAHSE